jgi:acetyl-CoA/propionyl-CoA carboxylase, biotin carboxylase, biotin carboxyl carrier protein
MPIRKVLIANRGEIAVRIIRTLRTLGLPSVVVYHAADAGSLAVREADEAIELSGPTGVAAYLDVAAILAAARRTGADAIHPGYGFLAENADFAAAVEAQGLRFIGPPPEVIRLMGDKIRAREQVAHAGFPITPSATEEGNPDAFTERVHAIGFPVLVKAAAGGGGRGMRIVRSADALAAELETARREAERSFKDGRVYVERYVERPRHIEVQVLSDRHGNHLHLGERECSVQRRFQKLIEETPSAALDLDTRRRLCDAAVGIAGTVGYENAGTVEFIFAPSGEFYFLEMNTRLQVEHPVTEMVTGLDLVAEQIAVANGEPLRLRQDDIRALGHAIECRICAEDADHGHTPTNGEVALLRPPAGPGVRFDSGLCVGQPITTSFDSMLAKLVVHGSDRPQAILRMRQALRDLVLLGVEHNAAYLERVLAHPGFGRGELHTHFLEEHKDALGARPAGEQDLVGLLAAAALVARRASLETPEPYASIGPWRN